MTEPEQIIECPCYPICSGLGLETGRWCRYRPSDLPPPGMHKFNPKDTWCPPGVQANVIMLGHMLAGDKADPERLQPALDSVRRWLHDLRNQPASSYGRGQAPPSKGGE